MDLSVLSIPLPEDLMKLKWNGQFELMKEMIDLRIQKDIPSQLKERLKRRIYLYKRTSLRYIKR